MRPYQADQLRDLIRLAKTADDTAHDARSSWCNHMFALARAGVLDDLLEVHDTLNDTLNVRLPQILTAERTHVREQVRQHMQREVDRLQARLNAAEAKLKQQCVIPDTVTLECVRDVLEAWAAPGIRDLPQAIRALRKVIGLEPEDDEPDFITPAVERQHCEQVCLENGWGLLTLNDQGELEDEIPDPRFVELLMRERAATRAEHWVKFLRQADANLAELQAVRKQVEHIKRLPEQWLQAARDVELFAPEPCTATGLARAAEDLLGVLLPV